MTIFDEKRNKIFTTRRLKDIFNDINLERHNWMLEEEFASN